MQRRPREQAAEDGLGLSAGEAQGRSPEGAPQSRRASSRRQQEPGRVESPAKKEPRARQEPRRLPELCHERLYPFDPRSLIGACKLF